jgi:anti-sigma regulatory factor (Ser/Thr protein kinase)
LTKHRESRYIKAMNIHIPNSAFLGNLNHFLRGFDPTSPETLEITSNEKWMAVHPVVLAMIAARGLTVDPGNINCNRFTARSKNYIIRMGLLDFLRLDPADDTVVEHEPAGRFIPLSRIRTSEESTRFITEMIPLLHLQDMPDQAKALSYIVSELVRNVLEHAQTEHGAIICAQYYQKSNSIGIGIADTGLGIKKTINRSYPATTDLEAIRLALQPGITGTTKQEGGTPENAGAGLFFIKSIANVNRDFFVIYSGNAFYKLLRKQIASHDTLHGDPFDDRHSTDETYPYWQGTVVGVDITLDRTREFSELLKLIHATYGKDIRERKKARYRKPRFTS